LGVDIKPTPREFLVNALSSNVSTHYTLEVFNPGDAVPVADAFVRLDQWPTFDLDGQ
jgi:hypothetical protein